MSSAVFLLLFGFGYGPITERALLEPARGSMVGAEVGPQMSVPIQCLAVDRVLRLVELEIPDNVPGAR